MKQVTLMQGPQAIRGWIEDRGAHRGAMVEVPEQGGFWRVMEVFDFSMDSRDVKDMADRARQPFTALKSYRGNK